MPSDVTIRIDADTAAYAAKMQQAGEKTKDVARETKGVGEAWEHANEHTAKHLIHLLSIAEAGKMVLEQMTKMNDKAKELSKQGGEQAIARDRAFASVGASAGDADIVNNQSGGTTNEERTAGVQALATLKKEGKVPITAESRRRYLQLMISGWFTQEELIERMRNGRGLPDDDELVARMKTFTPAAVNEFNMKDTERDAQQYTQDSALSKGAGNRARTRDADWAKKTADHPVLTALSNFPGIQQLRENSRYFNEDFNNWMQRHIDGAPKTSAARPWYKGPSDWIERHVDPDQYQRDMADQLQKQTQIMRQKPLNLSGQSEGAR